jgi:hypothetical protein
MNKCVALYLLNEKYLNTLPQAGTHPSYYIDKISLETSKPHGEDMMPSHLLNHASSCQFLQVRACSAVQCSPMCCFDCLTRAVVGLIHG